MALFTSTPTPDHTFFTPDPCTPTLLTFFTIFLRGMVKKVRRVGVQGEKGQGYGVEIEIKIGVKVSERKRC